MKNKIKFSRVSISQETLELPPVHLTTSHFLWKVAREGLLPIKGCSHIIRLWCKQHMPPPPWGHLIPPAQQNAIKNINRKRYVMSNTKKGFGGCGGTSNTDSYPHILVTYPSEPLVRLYNDFFVRSILQVESVTQNLRNKRIYLTMLPNLIIST